MTDLVAPALLPDSSPILPKGEAPSYIDQYGIDRRPYSLLEPEQRIERLEQDRLRIDLYELTMRAAEAELNVTRGRINLV